MGEHTIALLVAAGKSERMQSDIPKPYINVGREPLLRWTMKQFLSHPGIYAVRVIIRREHHPVYMQKRGKDVLVLPNLYGDIISDLCAGLIGGLGIAPGANIGDGLALFEPVHGSAPKYAGKNKVNPTATILSGALLLRHIGETKAADRLEHAVNEVLKENKFVTYDLKPHRDDPAAVGTHEMAEAICHKLP